MLHKQHRTNTPPPVLPCLHPVVVVAVVAKRDCTNMAATIVTVAKVAAGAVVYTLTHFVVATSLAVLTKTKTTSRCTHVCTHTLLRCFRSLVYSISPPSPIAFAGTGSGPGGLRRSRYRAGQLSVHASV